MKFESSFTQEQLTEIVKGIENGVDVNIYADIDFNPEQMREIRYGLERGLDVSIYTDADLPAEAMSVVRYGLLKGIRVEKISSFTREEQKREQRINRVYDLIQEQDSIVEDLLYAGMTDEEMRNIVEGMAHITKEMKARLNVGGITRIHKEK